VSHAQYAASVNQRLNIELLQKEIVKMMTERNVRFDASLQYICI